MVSTTVMVIESEFNSEQQNQGQLFPSYPSDALDTDDPSIHSTRIPPLVVVLPGFEPVGASSGTIEARPPKVWKARVASNTAGRSGGSFS
jgi:hypothetical protein